MSRPKITLLHYDAIPGRWYLHVTCDQHGIDWRLDSPSVEPSDWEYALTLAYGHACWASHCDHEAVARVYGATDRGWCLDCGVRIKEDA